MTQLSFRPYAHDQIVEIITHRLAELGSLFDANAVTFLAKKAAALTGDLRLALKIAQR